MTGMLLAWALLQAEHVSSNRRCAECHEESVDDWKPSAHASAQIGCVECHGADRVDAKRKNPHFYDATFSPGVKNANVRLCAACHKAEATSFKSGRHWEDPPKPKGELKGCNMCHAYHGTLDASRDFILKESCFKCHKEGTPERSAGEAYVARMRELEESLKRLLARVADKKPGVPWRSAAEEAQAAESALAGLRIEQHGCRYAQLDERAARPTAEAVSSAYNRLSAREAEFGRRYWGLLGFLALLALNAVLVRVRGRRWRTAA